MADVRSLDRVFTSLENKILNFPELTNSLGFPGFPGFLEL